jgi:alpha-glucosidase
LEAYRTMLAFRRGMDALLRGKTTFFPTPEPVLAFQRGTGQGAVVCIFNLSPEPVTARIFGAGEQIGPSQGASLSGSDLRLGPNGFAFLVPAAGATVRVEVTPDAPA